MSDHSMMKRRSVGVLFASALFACGTQARALDVPAIQPRVEQAVEAAYPDLEALLKTLHGEPELSFHEVKTAARLAKQMRALGFEVTEKVGKTGLVAIYRNGPGPVVMVRTDMDALPMEERSGLAYASKVQAPWKGEVTPVAHSCGHDFHMVSWVGAARTLLAMKERWQGTLMFIAQPAEEGGGGAKAMVEDGLFTRFPKPDYMLALHVLPLPAGTVGYRPGAAMAGVSDLKIVFKGRGGAGHSPHLAIDPVFMSARFMTDVQGVISRAKDPGAFGVLTFGAIHGGSATNIIPDDVTLLGTMRSYDAKVHATMLSAIERTAKATAQMAGAPDPILSVGPSANALINDPALAERAGAVFNSAFGDKALLMEPLPASEDFVEYAVSGAPTMYFFIGAYDAKAIAAAHAAGRSPPPNHSPQFAPDLDSTIRTGVKAMSLLVLELTQKPHE
jgi:hippurate hydrolase